MKFKKVRCIIVFVSSSKFWRWRVFDGSLVRKLHDKFLIQPVSNCATRNCSECRVRSPSVQHFVCICISILRNCSILAQSQPTSWLIIILNYRQKYELCLDAKQHKRRKQQWRGRTCCSRWATATANAKMRAVRCWWVVGCGLRGVWTWDTGMLRQCSAEHHLIRFRSDTMPQLPRLGDLLWQCQLCCMDRVPWYCQL